jgi:hypothetical protein
MRLLAAALTALLVGAGLAAALPATGASAGGDIAGDARTIDRPALPEQWQRTYGGEGDDTFADVVRTDDGGYLAVGWAGGEDRDGWVVKTDAKGEVQWERTFGESGTDRFYGVARTEDGYVLAGRTDRDGSPRGWVVEIGPGGEPVDERTPGPGAFYALEPDESGYLLAGWARGDGREGWALRLDANRSTEWAETYPTPESYGDGYLRAIVPRESGYYVAGKVEGDSDDGWALAIGSDGAAEWQTTAGGPDRDDVWAAAPADDGFLFAGETESDSTGPRDGWLVKVGANGSVEWERRPGGNGTQWLDSAMQTEEGFLFTGSSNTGPYGSADGYVVATDADGRIAEESYYGTSGWDKPWPAIRAHDGGYLLAGQTAGADAEGRDGWLVRIGATDATETATTADESATDTPTDEGPATTALRAETATGTETPSTGVPGFGPTAAVLGLLLAVLVARLYV